MIKYFELLIQRKGDAFPRLFGLTDKASVTIKDGFIVAFKDDTEAEMLGVSVSEVITWETVAVYEADQEKIDEYNKKSSSFGGI